MTTDLDTFEALLLAELRTTVTARAGNQPLLQPASELRLRRRIAAACGGVAAAVAGAFLVPGVLASPAYAVHDGPGGTIDVQVNRLDDAAGLQRALADHGVNADVQYLGNNMKCTPRRYSQASAVLDSSTRFAVGKGISVELDRRDVADGETVVIAASRIPNGVYAELGSPPARSGTAGRSLFPTATRALPATDDSGNVRICRRHVNGTAELRTLSGDGVNPGLTGCVPIGVVGDEPRMRHTG